MTTQVDKTRPREIKRKLTAILSADVKGYSRLMGEDEEWTLRTLNAYKEVMRSLIQQHQGRVVSTEGDRVLAEFASVVDAVQCAVEIQQVLRAKNAVLPENRRMEFRIGINLGDVIEEGDSIYGDGVNIAARLEGLAEAGGICISESAYQQIENKLPLRYQYLGEHQVKNIAKPVRAYRAQIEPEGVIEKKAKPRQWQRTAIGLVVILIVVAVAVMIWKFYMPPTPQPEVASKDKITAPQPEKPSATIPTAPAPSVETALKEKVTPPLPEKVTKPAPPLAPKMEVASKEKMAFPLPDEPSVAVMPFVNMSEDPKQEFLCDGITEEIITTLSKVARLFVISRQSTFSYKGKPVKVKQVSEELGVRYVLEGSVRKEGDKIRITAQLIDALTGHHIWAERYDRDLKDIFALQDEITMKIVSAMRVKLTEGEQALKAGKPILKPRLDCYMKILEGFKYFETWNIEGAVAARGIAEQMIAMCPEYPWAYVLMGHIHLQEYFLRIGKSPQESVEKGIEMAKKAVAMDDTIPSAHALLCALYPLKREYDKGIAEGERAIALDPGGAVVHEWYAMSLSIAGRPEEAIPFYQKSFRLNPRGPVASYISYGITLTGAGRFEEAVSAYKKVLQRLPDNFLAHLGLAVTYSMMGREQEARAEAAEILRLNPKFSVDNYVRILPYKDQARIDRIAEALRKAGLK
jgi:TolB-like protein/class 3 adenylate cyclase